MKWEYDKGVRKQRNGIQEVKVVKPRGAERKGKRK